MKILVCISHVPDTTSKINFVNNDSEFVVIPFTWTASTLPEIKIEY